MTTDKVCNGIKARIEAAATGALADVNVYVRDDASERTPPFIVIADTGSEEHPVLKGVLTISVETRLYTVSVDDPEDADTHATSTEEHQELNALLYDILADEVLVQYLESADGLRCFDVRGNEPTTEPEEGMRVTIYKSTVVACLG